MSGWSILLLAAASATLGDIGREAPDAPVRTLDAHEIDALRSGTGMGLAKAAEINGYPGPGHVIAMADELGLTDDQRLVTQRILDRLSADAMRLGIRILDAERALDTAFKRRLINADDLLAMTRTISDLRAELRFLHLKAHLEETALLTSEQVARYRELRAVGVTGAPGGGGVVSP